MKTSSDYTIKQLKSEDLDLTTAEDINAFFDGDERSGAGDVKEELLSGITKTVDETEDQVNQSDEINEVISHDKEFDYQEDEINEDIESNVDDEPELETLSEDESFETDKSEAPVEENKEKEPVEKMNKPKAIYSGVSR